MFAEHEASHTTLPRTHFVNKRLIAARGDAVAWEQRDRYNVGKESSQSNRYKWYNAIQTKLYL